MRYHTIILAIACLTSSAFAESDNKVQDEIRRLQAQTQQLQTQLQQLQKNLVTHEPKQRASKASSQAPLPQAKKKGSHSRKKRVHTESLKSKVFRSSNVSVHTPEKHPENAGFFPTALVAENRVITYIAGTPVVTAPYLGDRPAFDGSDFIVNISSINRDVRMMMQRRRLYDAYKLIGYPAPPLPIVALSGKVEPAGVINNPYNGNYLADFNLGSSELDVAAALNENVEGYIALAYDSNPPAVGPRVSNSAFNLNMGFINIGNLDRTPFYFTAGQLYVPFGRYSTSMISAPLALDISRTKTRPFILGYKSPIDFGPFVALYGYRSDTTLGRQGVGGVNVGYIFNFMGNKEEIGFSYISSMNDAGGMQANGSAVGTTFGGFGSLLNGSENVRKTPAIDVHANLGYGPFAFQAEWVGALEPFRPQDLSFNGNGAQPSATQFELDMTFVSFARPSSVGVSYQFTKQALALNVPAQRVSAVYNISIWKDTVESIEYRHDMDYSIYSIGNGAAPAGLVNQNTVGSGTYADTALLQIGVYF